MARGITENDVFTACDALLLAGERPTIERVRQKIGRGSPNTVSPMLDTWFRGLGRRLQDPGMFAPPRDIPEPVMQAAQHFWDVAQVNARVDFEANVQERLAPMHAELDHAQHLTAVAIAGRDATSLKAREALQQLADVMTRLDAERAAHAAASARLEAAQRQTDELTGRLNSAEVQVQASVERTHAEIQAAHERATGAERRAALQIENERSARGRADKRADALEKRVEGLQATSTSQVEELAKTRAALDHAQTTAAHLRATNESAYAERKVVDAALVEAKLAVGRAEAEAKAAQAAMARLLPLFREGKPKKADPRARQRKMAR